MKNISSTIKHKLSEIDQVLAINTKDLLRKEILKKIRLFQPDIIHYLHGPTIRSLVMLKVLNWMLRKRAKVVVSATRPFFSQFSRQLVPLFRPTIILTQSSKWERFFLDMGCNVSFIPNGVDCSKFFEVNEEEKQAIRRKLNLAKDKKVILHVGHLKQNRNLDVFKEMQKSGEYQVVIVGGTHQKSDEGLKQDLVDSGVLVLHEFFEDISHVYKAADLYVFPVPDIRKGLPDSYNQIGAIDLPLSVFEAMACNLPVVTTKFGALERIFTEGGGFYYVDEDQLLFDVVKVASLENRPNTRRMILPYDWVEIVGRLREHYISILSDATI